MNFTRTFIVDIARALAGLGIASWLPDLPGTGESLRELSDIGWDDWRDAARTAGETVATHSGRKPHVIALRGGTLLSDAVDARSWWSFAAASGASLLRDLQRTQLITDRGNPSRSMPHGSHYAGYSLSLAMREGLGTAVEPAPSGPHREAPLDLQDSRSRLWRRAEPGRDRELSEALAADIAAWINSCEPR
jgi:hypothetical protein